VTTDAPGSTNINGGSVITTGAQTYNDAVVLGANTTLTSTSSGAISLNSTVNGAFSLTVNTAGATTFAGAVGGTTALTSVTTDAPGSTAINGGSITTTTTQTYNDPVSTPAGTTTLTSTTNQAISFGSNIRPGGPAVIGTISLATTAVTTLTAANTFNVDVNGPASADQLANAGLGGGINLGGATLSVNVLASAVGDVYTIVSSPSGGITGTFAGLANGSTFMSGGRIFLITYTATAVKLLDAQAPAITSAASAAFTVGTFGSFTITTTGTPTASISLTGTLPTGLSFTNNGNGTATISGTPIGFPPPTIILTITASNGVSPPAVQTFTLNISHPALTRFAQGSGAGGAPEVKVFDTATGQTVLDFLAFDPSFTGGVSVAMGDINGDGVADVIVGAGTGSEVRVFDGKTTAMLFDFFAFGPGFTGGVSVAAGPLLEDGGIPDIIVGAGPGALPEVKAFSGIDGSPLRDFYAYDTAFVGGVTVAAGNVNGSSVDDIITGTVHGAPHVKVFDGLTGDSTILFSFFAYDPNYIGGVNVAAVDMNGDGKADIITGAGGTLLGSGAHVRIFSGADLTILQSFFPFGPDFAGGARVAAVEKTSDGNPGLVTAAGPLDGPQVFVWDAVSLQQLDSFLAFNASFSGGVFVGGG
jgi:hypothetical protein